MVKAAPLANLSTAFLSLSPISEKSPLASSSVSQNNNNKDKLIAAMTENGVLLHPVLEKHVDTDFNVGEVTPSCTASAVPSAAASVSGNDNDGDDNGDTCVSNLNPLEADEDEAEAAVPKIVACGKGGALYLPAIFSKVIELSGVETPNVVYIGTASFDADKNYLRHSGEFASRGCEVRRLDVSESSTVQDAEEMRHLVVDWADVLLCSGGNTLHALLRWKETGLDLLLKEAAEQGTVLCGGSAGAGCWFSSIHSDSLRPDNVKNAECVKNELDDEDLTDWDYVKISGLGIIPAMCVPHFETTGTNEVARSEHAEQVLVESDDNVPAIGIDENAALVVDGDMAMVVSGDGEATCHVVVTDEKTGETITEPIEPDGELVPLEELMDVQS